MKWVLSILLALNVPIALFIVSTGLGVLALPVWFGAAVWTAMLWNGKAPTGKARYLGNTLALLALLLGLGIAVLFVFVLAAWSKM